MSGSEETKSAIPVLRPLPKLPGSESPVQPPLTSPTTDADIDKEVEAALGGASIEDLMAQSVAGTPTPPTLDPSRPVRGGRPSARPGSPDNNKRGRVVSIREGNVFVDLGGKSQGICPLEQFDEIPDVDAESGLRRAVEIGKDYDFVYQNYDAREGLVMLARLGAIVHGAWETLKPGDTVEATVTGVNKGGLELKVNNAKAFMPAGQVDTKFNPDLSIFLNQRMTCTVTKVDRADRQILLSRRDLLEVEEAKQAEKTWEELTVGQIREGTVRSVQPYGTFVNIGGVDGLLHVSAMSHTRVTDPKKFVKEGDKVQVMVLAVDKDKKRVGLGLKQLTTDPWESVVAEFPAGTIVSGPVKKIMDFGAFVEIAPGVEGLVHISQVAARRIAKVSEVIKEGEIVKAKVLSVDLDKHRISLSIADVERETRAAETAANPAAAAPAGGVAGAPAAAAASKKPVVKKNLKGGLQ